MGGYVFSIVMYVCYLFTSQPSLPAAYYFSFY